MAIVLTISAFWPWPQTLAPQSQTAPSEEDVIHINVNLVQIDAVVTDSKRHLVTDLKAGDFEVLQDGKRQKITNFTYVNLRPAAPTANRENSGVPRPKGAPPPPPAMVRPERACRTIALMIDDLGLSFDSVARVRGALKKFVDSEMQPGDLAAILQTGRGMGALQQFTADKRLLHAAIDRVRFNAMGRVGVSGNASRGAEQEGIVAASSLGVIRYVVNGLREVPGRKAVILFSQSLKLFDSHGENDRVMEGVHELEDAANRASVVIYSIDPSGLETLQLTAADDAHEMSMRQIARAPQARAMQQFRAREGLAMLANDTGGRFFADSNDVAGELRNAVEDTEGYYLLGYHPDASTFDVNGRPKFHSVKVKLLRAGLEARSRSGFFGRSDLLHPPKSQDRDSLMRAALTSPFGANGIHVRLSTFYAQAQAGPMVQAMLLIDAKDLRFTDEPDGRRKAVLDVAAVTFDEKGDAVDSSSKTYNVQLKEDAYEAALKNGLVYNMQHPIKAPGPYQFRVALRDADSNQLGSASEFIEAPDLAKGKLTLSSLMLRKYAAQNNANLGASTGSPAARTFQPGDEILYGYQILNAREDANHKPDIEAYARVFRDGQEIFTGKPAPLQTPPDLKQLMGVGILRLGQAMQPGDYVVQVVVEDKAAKTTATQWTDFEVTGATAPGQ
jgi:VWFA-related protein